MNNYVTAAIKEGKKTGAISRPSESEPIAGGAPYFEGNLLSTTQGGKRGRNSERKV